MENKTITLSMATAEAIIQYLASKPYCEVYRLIETMKSEADVYAQNDNTEHKPSE